jgi:hypothetical protein
LPPDDWADDDDCGGAAPASVTAAAADATVVAAALIVMVTVADPPATLTCTTPPGNTSGPPMKPAPPYVSYSWALLALDATKASSWEEVWKEVSPWGEALTGGPPPLDWVDCPPCLPGRIATAATAAETIRSARTKMTVLELGRLLPPTLGLACMRVGTALGALNPRRRTAVLGVRTPSASGLVAELHSRAEGRQEKDRRERLQDRYEKGDRDPATPTHFYKTCGCRSHAPARVAGAVAPQGGLVIASDGCRIVYRARW